MKKVARRFWWSCIYLREHLNRQIHEGFERELVDIKVQGFETQFSFSEVEGFQWVVSIFEVDCFWAAKELSK
jgi:hypothetical protein